MNTYNIIVSLLIADILSVSMFVLLDWKPMDIWERMEVLAKDIVKTITPIVKSISDNHARRNRSIERISPAIIVIDHRGVFRQLTPREVRELYASIKYSEDGRIFTSTHLHQLLNICCSFSLTCSPIRGVSNCHDLPCAWA